MKKITVGDLLNVYNGAWQAYGPSELGPTDFLASNKSDARRKEKIRNRTVHDFCIIENRNDLYGPVLEIMVD